METSHIDVSISSVVCLGKRSDKPRPLRIVFDSPQSVFTVFKFIKLLLNILHCKKH